MKYQDTIEQANHNLQKTLGFLKQHRLAASPINYSVVYEYVSAGNKDICQRIDTDLKANKTIDAFLMESLYNEHLLQSDSSQETLVGDISDIVNTTQKHANKAQRDTNTYITLLDEGLLMLDGAEPELSKQVITKLLRVTSSIKAAQQILVKALKQASSKTQELQSQIDEIQQNRQLDPLTGLFNRSVLNQTVDIWLNKKVENIAAIAIDLDHFRQFNDNYGYTIGNVILSKVAQKVKSYVADSGLPVRTGGEEFLVLIPDADLQSAQEIAEKVRHGVEKLQFVNAKTKQKLPKITISLGVAKYSKSKNIDDMINNASAALRMAKATGRNRVYLEHS